MGATKRSDYALPSCYKYPLYFHRKDGSLNVKQSIIHTRAAAAYFSRFRHMYPLDTQFEIASNIDKAKRRFGIGAYRTKSRKVVSIFRRKARRSTRRLRRAAA